jgi:ribosomal protein L7/L12
MLNLNAEELEYLITRLTVSEGQLRNVLLEKFQEEQRRVLQYVSAAARVEACSFVIVGAQKDRIAAVKLYRSVTGTGLREAHDYVNNLLNDGKEILVQSTRVAYEQALVNLNSFPKLSIELR